VNAAEPHALTRPPAQHRLTGRAVGVLLSLGSVPTLRYWSGHWWLPSHHRVTEAERTHPAP
jgi:hypothetical protein